MELLKVSAKSNPNMVAGAIAGITRENKEVELQAIGAGSVNQAIKAIAVARAFLEEDGIAIACIPGFAEITVEDEARTAIRFTVIRI
ncbi:MAG: stage V sporulation protein S [Clostridia bacterium]|nr:stage V sporulation protein S [Clostridia bacterium]